MAKLDLRPGYRQWSGLPPAPAAEAFAPLLQQVLAASAPVTPFADPAECWPFFASLLQPEDWVLYLDAGTDNGPNSVLEGLRSRLGARLYRISPRTAQHEMARLLEASPERRLRLVWIPQVDPGTAEGPDMEELLFLVKQKRPEALCVADISHSLGLLPFYHDAWQADVTLFRRMQLGNFLITKLQEVGAIPASPPRTALLPYLQAAVDRKNSEIWNQVMQEAAAFRAELKNTGAELTPQQPSAAITGFRYPGKKPQEILSLLESKGFRLGTGQTLHREPHLLVQHAPEGPGGLAHLAEALPTA